MSTRRAASDNTMAAIRKLRTNCRDAIKITFDNGNVQGVESACWMSHKLGLVFDVELGRQRKNTINLEKSAEYFSFYGISLDIQK
ncbi:hypothetical protein T265_07906 [Opisthorchis viverrini]|uniref:Uncharacterized protein n=1 Tax=Opisthorchis viverrini TaxID=6198 RepID=A0A074ZAU5_OPIVI|nr:hypothetical protein T265_07906 [Opisthorchis viverrini]KER24431.1 hypothetical protein T265_07906 [Opisthorchis viverrini]